MTWTVATYLVYLALSLPLTIWVGTTLSRNGRVFLADTLRSDDGDTSDTGDDSLAVAVDRLLVVGFYLLNLGFISLYLRIDGVVDLRGMIEQLSVKLGVVMLVVGLVHVANVFAFTSMRRRHRREQQALQGYPVQPPAYAPPYPTAGR